MLTGTRETGKRLDYSLPRKYLKLVSELDGVVAKTQKGKDFPGSLTHAWNWICEYEFEILRNAIVREDVRNV
jgi:hypothetical protein